MYIGAMTCALTVTSSTRSPKNSRGLDMNTVLIDCGIAESAFYLYPYIGKYGLSCEEFCERCSTRGGVRSPSGMRVRDMHVFPMPTPCATLRKRCTALKHS